MSSLLLASSRIIRLYHRGLVWAACAGLFLAALLPATLHAQGPRRFLAPDFDGAVGPTLGSDKPIKLKDLRGKIVVLEFWTLC
jgi:hypothetical protein